MPDQYERLFDEVGYCLNHSLRRQGSIFIQASPMTHDPRFTLRFVQHPNLLTAAIVYDFIPLDWPGYLTEISHRIDYLSKLVRLKNSDIFLSISRYSARRLMELIGVSANNVQVTGASIRESLIERVRTLPGGTSETKNNVPYFLTVGAGDLRKDTATVVRAVCQMNRALTDPVRLRIVGDYSSDQNADLQRIAAESAQCLEFLTDVDDGSLATLYAGAIATVVSSQIEGFSLPVAEAALCGSPVIASRCAAHLELIDQPEALFEAGNVEQLTGRLTRANQDTSFREALIRAQGELAEPFHAEAVRARFWDFIMSRFERDREAQAPALAKHAKPKVAFISPFPPDQSGVARFTERTVSAASKHFQIDLFTDAPRPLLLGDGVRDAGKISVYALLKNRYDSIISVLGNSRFHLPIIELFERYGGPCIMHDSRLTQIYFHRLGQEKFLQFANKLLGRPVEMDEVSLWLEDRQPPSFFIEPLAERAKPMIVHTRRYQEMLRERYHLETELATFPANCQFTEEELSEGNRTLIRHSLGFDDAVFVIASFGIVDRSKGVLACIVALDLLRFWKIPAMLIFVGKAAGLEHELRRVAIEFGVDEHVSFFTDFVSEEKYRSFLIGCDAAIQLRTYDFGQPSAALADCISVGVPTVATCSLAETCDAPSYVLRIPDHISSLLLAERLAEIWERQSRLETSEERMAHNRRHSFEYYATRLAEILNL